MNKQKLVSNNISYSLIKRFEEEGPVSLINYTKKTGIGLSFGSAADEYILSNDNSFYDKYIINDKPIAPMLVTLANAAYNALGVPPLGSERMVDYREEIINIVKELDLWKNIKKDATLLNKFDNINFYNYINMLSSNLTIVDIKDFVNIKEINMSLKTSKNTKHIFINDLETIYQKEINFEYEGENVKCFLDKIDIDHENKIIYPYDLKTGSVKSEDFMKSFMTFKYYLQGKIYTDAVAYLNKTFYNNEYKIAPFRFIYINRLGIKLPLVYEFNEKWYNAATYGFETKSGYIYKGFNELVELIKWHKENNIFNVSKYIFENDIIQLNNDFIYEKKE